MVSSILSLLSGIANSIAGFFKLRSSPNRQRREAEKDVAAKEAAIRGKKDEIRSAVYANDDDRLNAIAAKLLNAVLLCAVFGAVAACTTQPSPVYIPTDRRIESCTNSIGIACKAVPDAVMVEMLEKLQELQDLKTQRQVDKRLGK